MTAGDEWAAARGEAARLIRLATSLGLSVATAESCTGGLLSALLTSVPGSSSCFECGFVTYSNHAKRALLAVDRQLVEQMGAVSEPVVLQMASGALERSGADLAVAISGIAGPGGGTAAKPVGTVWFGWARRGLDPLAECRLFAGDRDRIRRQAVEFALAGLLKRCNQPGQP